MDPIHFTDHLNLLFIISFFQNHPVPSLKLLKNILQKKVLEDLSAISGNLQFYIFFNITPYARVAILLPKISYQKCKMDNFNFSPIFPNFKLLLSLYLASVMRLLFLTYIFGKLITL